MTVQLTAEQVLDEHPQASVLSVDFCTGVLTYLTSPSFNQPRQFASGFAQAVIVCRGVSVDD
jgi:hypothetical protein